MSQTPTGTTGNAPAQQTAQQDKKPTLTGVRIKQRKGQAKAAAKFEPEAFRDQLFLHLALVPIPPTTDALVNKLVQAGSTLEFLKYSEQLFELLFVGGLLQPGGSYLDDKRSPVYLLKTDDEIIVDGSAETGGDEGWKDSVKGIIETLKRVIQRYKYLQKPLEENFMPDFLSYLPKWDHASREKLAEATALLIVDLQVSPRCLASLTRDHVVKDGVGLEFFTSFSRQYLAKQPVEVLGSTIKKSGLKDILLLLPFQTRDRKHLEDHFKNEKLPQINEWYAKLAMGEAKEGVIANIGRMINEEEANEQIVEYLKGQRTASGVTDADLCDWIWTALMNTVDWTARADQIDNTVVQHVSARCSILEAFCNGAKAEVGLINSVQTYCYTDTRIMKAFASLIKVLYNQDCISDQAIIYWHQKGAKPQGKQHFLKATDALVAFLEDQDESEEE